MQRTGALLETCSTDFPEHSGLARDILICEQEGDRITHDIIHAMTVNGSKLDQRDAYELARALDDVVDFAEETADSLELYAIEAPMEQAASLAAVLAGASKAVAAALAHCARARTLPPISSRSTASRTRATGSRATRSHRCSRAAQTRWS